MRTLIIFSCLALTAGCGEDPPVQPGEQKRPDTARTIDLNPAPVGHTQSVTSDTDIVAVGPIDSLPADLATRLVQPSVTPIDNFDPDKYTTTLIATVNCDGSVVISENDFSAIKRAPECSNPASEQRD